MNVYVTPGQLNGSVYVPPSKSYAHRYILCAALSRGTSIINNFVLSDDLLATLDAIKELGAEYKIDGDQLQITGTSSEIFNSLTIGCKESGSTLRFLVPISLVFSRDVIFTGTYSLLERGISVFKDIFLKKGISVMQTSEEIHINGEFTPGRFELPNSISSQYVSGLFFALPRLKKNSMVHIKSPIDNKSYIDMTVEALRKSGVYVSEPINGLFTIKGGQSYKGTNVTLEGDWACGASLLAYNFAGSNIRVKGLDDESLQIDKDCERIFEQLSEGAPTINIGGYLDLGPIFFAVAAANHGATFNGLKKLREKEPNRINSMLEELKNFSIKYELTDDSLTISKSTLKRPSDPVQAHGDHRVAMALTFLLSITGGIMQGAETINKSYPAFFNDLQSLGLKIHFKE